jgi:hypothetical protein
MGFRATAKRWLLPFCIGLLLSLAYFEPAFREASATGFGDWQMVHHNWEVGRVAIQRFGEWPAFDPYHCGGVTMLGNPESQHFSPLFLVSLLVGTTLATKLFVAIHLAFGFAGTFRYARDRLAISPLGAGLAGASFAFSGFFAWHLAGGHATFAPFAFLPAVLLFWTRAEHDRRAAAIVALLLALTVAEGGTYPFPYMLLVLGVETAVRLVQRPEALRPTAQAGARVALLTALVGAVRFVPIAITLARHPRTASSHDASTLADVLTMLTARKHDWPFPLHEFVWPEYGTYVGWGVVGLAGFGVLRALRFRHRAAFAFERVSLAIAVALVLGNVATTCPWTILRLLPVFDSLRVPSRFMVVVTLHLALFAGFALDGFVAVVRRLSAPLATGLAAACALAVVVDLGSVTRPILDRWTGRPIDETQVATAFSSAPRFDYDAVYASLPAMHRGTDTCYVGGMDWNVSPELAGFGAAYARFDQGAGRITDVDRTNRVLRARVESTAPSVVLFGQGYDPDFVPSVGRLVDVRGMLGVALPEGTHALRVRYAPRYFPYAILASAFGLAVCLAWLLPSAIRLRLREGRSS